MSGSADNSAKTRSAHPGKLPWLRWSFDAWMADPGLRLCSVISRGVWIDLLAVAARSAEPGYLSHMGRPLSVRELSQHVNIRPKTIERALQELEAHGVFARDERGVIFSRRMKRDFRDYNQAVADGRKGGNKVLIGGGGGSGGGGQEARSERGESAEEARTERAENAQVPSGECARSCESNEIRDMVPDRVNPPVKVDEEKDYIRGDSRTFGVEETPVDRARVVSSSGAASGGNAKVVPLHPRPEWAPPVGTVAADEESACVEAWNKLAARIPNLAPVSGRLDPFRLRQLRELLRERGGSDAWMRALVRIEASAFWRGEVSGKQRRLSISHLLDQPATFSKLLEGFYDEWKDRGVLKPRQQITPESYIESVRRAAGVKVDTDFGNDFLNMPLPKQELLR